MLSWHSRAVYLTSNCSSLLLTVHCFVGIPPQNWSIVVFIAALDHPTYTYLVDMESGSIVNAVRKDYQSNDLYPLNPLLAGQR